jgi:D-alanyl-lipoteichoic acid acyltransferase DltB (MBOAT superfamily)
MKNFLKREGYIALHGQTSRFRVVKWVIILAITFIIYKLWGWVGVKTFILVGALLGIAVHFIFRWKTHGWTRPWGPMKEVIRTPYDE